MDESPVHDEAGINQSRVDIELGQGEKSGNFQIEVDEPVTRQRPGLLVGVTILFAEWTVDLVDNFDGYVVAEREGNFVFSATAGK